LDLDPQTPAHDAGRFRTTQWSAVLLSAQSQAPGAPAALAEVCRVYWYPLYGFVRSRGHGPEAAQDLTQGFFLHLLEHRALRHVSPAKGKFRSFLLASLQNYLANEADRARCLKRGGQVVEFVPLDAEAAEQRYRLEPADHLTPETLFDARWARALLGEVTERLRQEHALEGKAAAFETLKPFLDPLNGPGSRSYEQVARELQVSVGAVKTLIHRLRKRYSLRLREEIARTVPDPGQVDEEIRALCQALLASEGRLGP
jgi:RNA polymerase sigma factor (sigma-70 family)